MKAYADLYNMKEDARIEMIAAFIMQHPGESAVVIVETLDKAERYAKKLQAKNKDIRIESKMKDVPLKGMYSVKFCAGALSS